MTDPTFPTPSQYGWRYCIACLAIILTFPVIWFHPILPPVGTVIATLVLGCSLYRTLLQEQEHQRDERIIRTPIDVIAFCLLWAKALCMIIPKMPGLAVLAASLLLGLATLVIIDVKFMFPRVDHVNHD